MDLHNTSGQWSLVDMFAKNETQKEQLCQNSSTCKPTSCPPTRKSMLTNGSMTGGVLSGLDEDAHVCHTEARAHPVRTTSVDNRLVQQ